MSEKNFGGIEKMKWISAIRPLTREESWWLIEQAELARKLNLLIETHAPDGRNYTNAQYVELLHERQSLYEEVNRLREALAFYADTNNYELNDGIGEWLPTIPIDKDSGDIARKALENTK